jgi:hypothetical protein
LDDDPRRAVAERRLFSEALAHSLIGLQNTIAPNLLDHLRNAIRAASRLPDEALAREMNLSSLCTGTHEGPRIADHHAMWLQARSRHLKDFDLAIP